MDLSFTHQIYRLLLRLYPASFREAYGEEMLGVFQEALDEAKTQGSPAVYQNPGI